MTKKHKELVRELGKIVYDLDNISPSFPKGKAIEEAIDYILSAFRDGRLDKELGVVYRNRFRGYQEVGSLFLASQGGDATLPGSFHIDPPLRRDVSGHGEEIEVIALRPPEGTGKEGEVSGTNDMPRYCEHCGSEEHYTSEHY